MGICAGNYIIGFKGEVLAICPLESLEWTSETDEDVYSMLSTGQMSNLSDLQSENLTL